MTFLNPALLAAGLACIAIPILIHLLMQRRRKPIAWGAMRFLIEAYKRQQRRLKLERWLLLLARCLLIAALAMAFGKPLIGQAFIAGQSRTLYLLIDNSLAAQARGPAGTALDRHKRDARALIDSLRASGDGHRVGVITLGGPNEAIILPPSPDLGAVMNQIDRITPTDSRADLVGALTRVASEFAPSGAPESPERSAPAAAPERSTIAILSDFRRGSLPTSGADVPRPVRLPAGARLLVSQPALEPLANTAITRVEPLRSVIVANAPDTAAGVVRVELQRSGDAAGSTGEHSTTVSVWLARPEERGGSSAASNSPADSGAPPPSRATAVVRWSPGQDSAVAVVQLPDDQPPPNASDARARSSAQVLVAAIDGGDAIPGDDRSRRAVESRSTLRVGVAASALFGARERADQLSPGTWARLALAPTSDARGVDVVMIEPAAIDAARLAGLDALVLPRPDLLSESAWSRVAPFVEAGGLLIVFAPADVSVHTWTDQMSRALSSSIAGEWSIAREASALDGAPGVPGARLDVIPSRPDERDGLDLFGLIAGELGDLASSVRVRRLLPIQAAPDVARPLLSAGGQSIVSVLHADTPAPTDPPSGTPGNRAARRGLVVYVAVALDLEWSDMPAKPLMVPMMQELVRQGVGRARGTFLAVAGNPPQTPPRTVELRSIDRSRVTVESPTTDATETRFGAVRQAGVFAAIDDTGVERALIAVNPDTRASDVGAQEQRIIQAWLSGAGPDAPSAGDRIVWLRDPEAGFGSDTNSVAAAAAFGRSADSGDRTPIWTFLLAATLALGVLEMLLARVASHASQAPSAGGGPALAQGGAA